MKKALIGVLVLVGVIVAIAALMKMRTGDADDLLVLPEDVSTKAQEIAAETVDTDS